MKSIETELLMQMAVYTLENDFNMPTAKIQRFKERLNYNCQQMAAAMLILYREQRKNDEIKKR